MTPSRHLSITATLALAACSLPPIAPETAPPAVDVTGAPLPAEPNRQHRWLQQLVGDWIVSVKHMEAAGMGGQEPFGTEQMRPVGGLWVVGHGEMDMGDGSTFQSRLTLGYDAARQRFVGTWIDTVQTHMFVYEGTLDDSGRQLTLSTKGPSFTQPGTLASYRDVIRIVDADTRTLTSYAKGQDDQWIEFMTATYRRAGKDVK
jgi:hypothetical protein